MNRRFFSLLLIPLLLLASCGSFALASDVTLFIFDEQLNPVSLEDGGSYPGDELGGFQILLEGLSENQLYRLEISGQGYNGEAFLEPYVLLGGDMNSSIHTILGNQPGEHPLTVAISGPHLTKTLNVTVVIPEGVSQEGVFNHPRISAANFVSVYGEPVSTADGALTLHSPGNGAMVCGSAGDDLEIEYEASVSMTGVGFQVEDLETGEVIYEYMDALERERNGYYHHSFPSNGFEMDKTYLLSFVSPSGTLLSTFTLCDSANGVPSHGGPAVTMAASSESSSDFITATDEQSEALGNLLASVPTTFLATALSAGEETILAWYDANAELKSIFKTSGLCYLTGSLLPTNLETLQSMSAIDLQMHLSVSSIWDQLSSDSAPADPGRYLQLMEEDKLEIHMCTSLVVDNGSMLMYPMAFVNADGSILDDTLYLYATAHMEADFGAVQTGESSRVYYLISDPAIVSQFISIMENEIANLSASDAELLNAWISSDPLK